MLFSFEAPWGRSSEVIERGNNLKHVQLSVLLIIVLAVWGLKAQAEDSFVQDAETHDSTVSEGSQIAGNCDDVMTSNCVEVGQEADSLPSPGSVPLDELGESIEKGEEQFSGCSGHRSPTSSLPLTLLMVAGILSLPKNRDAHDS